MPGRWSWFGMCRVWDAQFGMGSPKPTRPMHTLPPFQIGFFLLVFLPWGRFARWDGISQILVGRQLAPGKGLGKMGCPHCKCQQWQEDFVKKGFLFSNVEFIFDLVPFFLLLSSFITSRSCTQMPRSCSLLPVPLRCNDFISLANCFYLPPVF